MIVKIRNMGTLSPKVVAVLGFNQVAVAKEYENVGQILKAH